MHFSLQIITFAAEFQTMQAEINKKKIFNDPVHGFISVPGDLIFDLVQHPYFQRLRRIKQLGMTHLVYPGALHTRFQHALGAMHLMHRAIEVLKLKGHQVSDEEAEAALIAILLHDIGHGPFSHALENTIIKNTSHEEISLLMMQRLNEEFEGKLQLAIEIFKGDYPKRFLHQLVSGQLDVDRLDYLKRDSFFTGVSEGVIGTERIISMLDVRDDELVVEAKGIYSIENFLVSRRIMYWQVYLHKTSLSAEYLLMHTLDHAKKLSRGGHELFATPALSWFLQKDPGSLDFHNNPEVLDHFAALDDFDIFTALKVWSSHTDKLLSIMAGKLTKRKLLRIEFLGKKPKKDQLQPLIQKVQEFFELTADEAQELVISEKISNHTYDPRQGTIKILNKGGEVSELDQASGDFDTRALARSHTKHFLLYPKEIGRFEMG